MADKSLSSMPRSSTAPELFVSHEPEVYHPAAPELIKNPFDVSKETVPTRSLPVLEHSELEHRDAELKPEEKHVVSDTSHPSFLSRWKWPLIGLSVLIVVATIVGGAVGGTVGRNSHAVPATASPTAPPATPSLAPSVGEPFNSTSPIPSLNVTLADWRSRSVYQVLTDRFARTDSSTSAKCDPAAREYCGGTWAGLIKQLDYIQNMGFTAIWISPVTAQLTENTGYGEAYHGYWQQDIWRLNPNFGTVDDLQALSAAVHARNMYLMVDVVVNHYGWTGGPRTVDYSRFSPFNNQSYFHTYCPITQHDYDSKNQTAIENCWLGDEVVELVDVDTENSFVNSTFQSWIKSLVRTFAIDGLRVDTVKHVPKTFWPDFNEAAGVYSIGEVFDGDPDYTCPYQDSLDGVFNYPLFFPLREAFRSSSGDMDRLADMLRTVNSSCNDPTLLGIFSENHDNARFPSLTNDISLIKNVIAFTLLGDGIPFIYQGQEAQSSGGNDPLNREAVWLSGYSTKLPLYTFIASVNQVRNQEVYKTPSYVTERSSVVYSDENNIVLRKGHILSVFTNSGANGPAYSLTLEDTGLDANQTLVEILTCANATTNSAGDLRVSMDQGLPKIFYPTSQISQSGICFL